MKISRKAILTGMGVLGLASAFVHPFGNVKGQTSTASLLSASQTTDTVNRVIERSCQNCHSERTDWPWYSYIPPVSWMIEKDVSEARGHMNLSRWGDYTTERQVEILSRLGAEVRNHQMPLPRYLSLHPDARLSETDVKDLYDWSHQERRRLTLSAAPQRKGSTD
jgi:hypothetical protein